MNIRMKDPQLFHRTTLFKRYIWFFFLKKNTIIHKLAYHIEETNLTLFCFYLCPEFSPHCDNLNRLGGWGGERDVRMSFKSFASVNVSDSFSSDLQYMKNTGCSKIYHSMYSFNGEFHHLQKKKNQREEVDKYSVTKTHNFTNFSLCSVIKSSADIIIQNC